MPVFDFSISGQDTQGQLKHFFGAVLLALWFCASASTLLQEGPGSPVHVEQSALDTTPFSKGRVDCRRLRQRQCDRTPPLSLRTFLRSTASKLPAPGNKSNTGEDGCSYMAFGSKVSSQCWPRCAPQCLLLLWGALEGLGRPFLS